MEEIIAPVPKELLKSELTEDKRLRLTNRSKNEIYVLTAADSPNVMREIGRLREIAFRAAGGWSPLTKGVQRLSGPWLLGVAPFRSNAVALDRVAYPVCDLYVVPSMTAAFVHRSDVIYAWI